MRFTKQNSKGLAAHVHTMLVNLLTYSFALPLIYIARSQFKVPHGPVAAGTGSLAA